MSAEILKATLEGIEKAARCLRAGGLVAFPTETVYGLGADATSPTAVARLYEAKGRPRFNPLIAHVESLDAALRLVNLSMEQRRLADAFWPGPLTLVAPRRAAPGRDPSAPAVCDLARAGLDTLAVRVPASPVAHALLAAAGIPVAAPSANVSGRPSPTEAAHVAVDLADRVDIILDDGPCRHGLESTIVGLDAHGRPALLRPGAITRRDLESVLGEPIPDLATGGTPTDPASPTAPGQLASHYAPDVALRLDAEAVEPGEGLLAFGPVPAPMLKAAAAVVNLSPAGDLREAAAGLFAALRALDSAGPSRFAVMPIPSEGLGEAIRDRLARAAAPRPPR